MLDPVAMATVGSGSYLPADVHILLRAMELAPTSVLEKERSIQRQQKHYSEMLGREEVPSGSHLAHFERALENNASRMAADVQALALGLAARYRQAPIVLVSFVRAGLPVGVLLRRALLEQGRDVHHYGISIVRGRGIDTVALEHIIARHGARSIAFVDGWTGKGAIATELKRSLAGDHRFPDVPQLVVLADPCGRAWLAASAQDWLIPSGVLGATVSGLVSRSVWPTDAGLHGCVVQHDLKAHDLTRPFIERVDAVRATVRASAAVPWAPAHADALQAATAKVFEYLCERFDTNDLNRIKPGIAEATRAVFRRVPDQVLVRDRCDPDVQLLIHLTRHAGIEVQEAGTALGSYRAATLIRRVS